MFIYYFISVKHTKYFLIGAISDITHSSFISDLYHNSCIETLNYEAQLKKNLLSTMTKKESIARALVHTESGHKSLHNVIM